VHARKAWLDGLSPKENRNIPPLRYDYVDRIKALYPDTTFILNGGLNNHDQALAASTRLDGVMMGREACSNPWILNQVDNNSPKVFRWGDWLSRYSVCFMHKQVVESGAGL